MDKNRLSVDDISKKVEYNPQTGEIISLKSKKPIGNKDKDGYIVLRLYGKVLRRARLAILLSSGTWPDGVVDHINRIKTDDRLSNLRVLTPSENTQNISLTGKNNYTGYMGVLERRGRYYARVRHNNVMHHFGGFSTPEEAYAVYVQKKKELHLYWNPTV